MISSTNNPRFAPRFPFRSTRSRATLLAACVITLSLAACANRKRAESVNLESDSSAARPIAVDAEHSASNSGDSASNSGVTGAVTSANRTIKSCPLPPPGTKPVCNRS